MKIYADTSALIAWFHPADQFSQVVTDWCQARSPEFSWNLLLRMELRHNLRRLSGKYATTAWHAYRASESSRKLRLETHRLPDILDRADELSARYAGSFHAGAWDFVHVAAAQQVRAEVFITCDSAQSDLARAVGTPKVHLFEI